MAAKLPTYIPLKQAARRYGVGVGILTRLAEEGRIRAAKTPEGRLLVAEEDLPTVRDHILPHKEDFAHLRGQRITVPEAAKEFGVPYTTLHGWIKAGYLVPVGREGKYRHILDKADVAYLAAVYRRIREQGYKGGRWLRKTLGQPAPV